MNLADLEACREAIMNAKLPASSRCPICGEPVHVFPDWTRGTACLYHLEQRARLFGNSEASEADSASMATESDSSSVNPKTS